VSNIGEAEVMNRKAEKIPNEMKGALDKAEGQTVQGEIAMGFQIAMTDSEEMNRVIETGTGVTERGSHTEMLSGFQ
jgi:hypothetical protein